MKTADQKKAAITGLTLAGIGFILFTIGIPVNNYWIGIFPPMLITSIGFGCVAPVSQYLATLNLDEDDAGIGSGITTTIQQLLQVVGVSVLASVATTYSKNFDNKDFITQNGFIAAFIISVILIIIGIIIVLANNKTLEDTHES